MLRDILHSSLPELLIEVPGVLQKLRPGFEPFTGIRFLSLPIGLEHCLCGLSQLPLPRANDFLELLGNLPAGFPAPLEPLYRNLIVEFQGNIIIPVIIPEDFQGVFLPDPGFHMRERYGESLRFNSPLLQKIGFVPIKYWLEHFRKADCHQKYVRRRLISFSTLWS